MSETEQQDQVQDPFTTPAVDPFTSPVDEISAEEVEAELPVEDRNGPLAVEEASEEPQEAQEAPEPPQEAVEAAEAASLPAQAAVVEAQATAVSPRTGPGPRGGKGEVRNYKLLVQSPAGNWDEADLSKVPDDSGITICKVDDELWFEARNSEHANRLAFTICGRPVGGARVLAVPRGAWKPKTVTAAPPKPDRERGHQLGPFHGLAPFRYRRNGARSGTNPWHRRRDG